MTEEKGIRQTMLMKRLYLLAFLFVLGIANQSVHADAFVPGLDDVPLMTGFDTDESAGIVFETPEGRIAEATVSGRASRAEALSFYETTLPQLGWQPSGNGSFQREQETLTIEMTQESGGLLTVRFRIKPEKPERK